MWVHHAEEPALDYPQRVPGSSSRRSGNPAVRASAGAAGTGATRAVVNQRSRTLLLRVSRLPPLVIPAATLVLMLVGLSAPLIYAIPALTVVAAFVAWLAYLSWPILSTGARFMRVFMLTVVIGCAVARLNGWL